MEKIQVTVFYAAVGKLFFKKRTYFLFAVEEGSGQLVNEQEAVAWIALYKAVTKRGFTLTADINACGIKIVEAFCHEAVDHACEFGIIDLVAVHRQTHTAESEIFFHVFKALWLIIVHFSAFPASNALPETFPRAT